MEKRSNLDILMIMFGFTFFSGSMLIGQTLSNGLDLREFDHAIIFKIALMVNKYLKSTPVKY